MKDKIAPGGNIPSRLDQRRRSANDASNESYTAKQREIVDTAVRIFTEKGYDATSLNDIGDAVKMDRATLYYYFKSKIHLLASAMFDALSDTLKEAEEIFTGDGDALSKLSAATRCIMISMADKHSYVALYFQDDIWRSPRHSSWIAPLREDEARITAIFQMIIADGQRDGVIRDDIPAELITRVVFGSLASSYRMFTPEDGHSVEEWIHSFDAILSTGVVPPKKSDHSRRQRKSTSRRDALAQS